MDSDGSHMLAGLTAALVLLGLRAFYSACETAITELSDAKVKSYENETGGKKMLHELLKSPARLRTVFSSARITAAALISCISVYIFSSPVKAQVTKVCESDFPASLISAGAVILLTILCVSIFGDNIPKTIVLRKRSEGFAVGCVGAVKLLSVIMKPITLFSDGVTSLLLRLFGISGGNAAETVTEEEILLMVDAGNETGSIESSEREMINNVFEFHELTVGDVMTHRTDITAVSSHAEISDVVYTAMDSGFSRIPVYEDSIDHIIGILYVKDLLCLIGTQSADGMSVKNFLRDIEYVPESCMCGDLFKQMTAGKIQVAAVVDEYGGTAGLVTMEDLVESIVGNIQDEYDNETEDITRISDNTFMISGDADPADVMDKLGITLPEENGFETMSGFLTELLGSIPEDGENPSAEYEGVRFTVLLTEDMRIIRIKAVINSENNKNKEIIGNEKKD